MENRVVRIIFLILAIVCFLGTAIFAKDMDPVEQLRMSMLGLAAFAASFIP